MKRLHVVLIARLWHSIVEKAISSSKTAGHTSTNTLTVTISTMPDLLNIYTLEITFIEFSPLSSACHKESKYYI